MAPILPLALAALVCASSSIKFADADDKATGKANTDNCLLGLNLARTGKIDASLSQLAKDTDTEGKAVEAINKVLPNKATCKPTRSDEVKGLILTAASNTEPTAGDITGLIQAEIQKGLAALGNNYDPATKFETGENKKFADAAAQNLAYIMFTSSTRVGCATGNDCTAGNNAVVCLFQPTLEATSQPFTEALYKAMEARQNAGINITKLTQADLGTKLTPDAPSAAVGAIPCATVIFLSLVGIMTIQ